MVLQAPHAPFSGGPASVTGLRVFAATCRDCEHGHDYDRSGSLVAVPGSRR
jgi:hypothetical protein